MVLREINWDSTPVSQVGNDSGFDKGNCSGKHYDGKVSELDDSLTDSFSHSFNQYSLKAYSVRQWAIAVNTALDKTWMPSFVYSRTEYLGRNN